MSSEMNLSKKLVDILLKQNLKIATAESCTGGLISKKITDIPGSSNVFECGICSYSNRIKTKILNVDTSVLKKYTAVSPQIAEQMAIGVKNLSGADISVSTTGYAGPKYKNSEEEVGLVYIGINYKNLIKVIKLELNDICNGDRNLIRQETTKIAIKEIINILD